MAGERKVEAVIKARDEAKPILTGFTKSLLAVGAAVGVTIVAFKKLSDGLKQALDNAIIQERAEIKLAGALSTLGQNTASVRAEMSEFASEMQDKFGIADDVILNAMANISGLGEISGEELKRATLATISLSAASGDMAGNAIIMSKAVAGMASSLGRYIGTLDPALSETEKMEQAFQRIEKRLGPVAIALGQTMEAALKKVKFAYGDVIDAIGMAIFNTDSFATSLGFVTGKLKEFEQFIKDNREALQLFGATTTEAFAFVAEGAVKLSKALVLVVQGQRLLLAVQAGSIEEFQKIRKETTELLNPLNALDEAIDGLQVRLAKFREEATKRDLAESIGNVPQLTVDLALGTKQLELLGLEVGKLQGKADAARFLAENFDSVTGAMGLSRIEVTAFANDLAALVEQLNALGAGIEFIPGEDAVEGVGELISLSEDLTRTFRTELAFAAARTGDTMVQAAFGAKIAWGQFMKQVLTDIASAIVQMLILRAISTAFGFGFFGASSGGEVTAGQHGGRVRGGVSGRDSVLALLQPGEIVLPASLKDDFKAITDLGRAIRSGGAPAVAGASFQMFATFQNVSDDDQAIRLMEKITELAERQGFPLTASDVIS